MSAAAPVLRACIAPMLPAAMRVKRYLGFKLFPSQERFLRMRRDKPDIRFVGFSGPVGSGKSRAFGAQALRFAAANPHCAGILAAPTYRMLADVSKPAVIEALELSRTPYKMQGGKDSIYLPEFDATMRFRSTERPERLIGQNLAWFGVDELTYTKEEAWKRLEARLRDPKAKMLGGFACWTPKGFDWVYDRFISEKKKPSYEAVLASPAENRAILDAVPDFYDKLKESYDERFYRQEVLGEYLNLNAGSVYHAFDRHASNRRAAYTPGLPIVWALDFNINPMASIIAQVYRAAGQFVARKNSDIVQILDELYIRDAHIGLVCQHFVDKVKGWYRGVPLEIHVYGDHSGHNRSQNNHRSMWAEILEYFKRPDLVHMFKIDLRVPVERNPPVFDRVAALNGKLCNANEERTLFIDVQKCPHLTNDLERVSWATTPNGRSTGEIDKSNKDLTHISDALGYFIFDEYGYRPATGIRPGNPFI